MVASSRGHASIAHQLILSGADLYATNAEGETAAQLVRMNPNLATLLEAVTYPAPTIDIAAGTARAPAPAPARAQAPAPTSAPTAAPTAAASLTPASGAAAPPPPPTLQIPRSVQLFAAGVPLQSFPQPTYHALVHHVGLLLTEIGPWLRATALPLASTHPEVKELIFTVIAHTYTLAFAHADVAERFFDEYLKPAAQAQQDAMPRLLHEAATKMGVNVALAPVSLRGVTNTSQEQYLAFMKPEHLHVVTKVLAECTPKFVRLRKEAEVAVADFANPNTGGGYSGQ